MHWGCNWLIFFKKLQIATLPADLPGSQSYLWAALPGLLAVFTYKSIELEQTSVGLLSNIRIKTGPREAEGTLSKFSIKSGVVFASAYHSQFSVVRYKGRSRDLVPGAYTLLDPASPGCPETLLPAGCRHSRNPTQPHTHPFPSHLLPVTVRSAQESTVSLNSRSSPDSQICPPNNINDHITISHFFTHPTVTVHCVLWKTWTLVQSSLLNTPP